MERRGLSESWWLFDASPDATLGIDAEGVIVFANAQAHALFGWDPADLVGQRMELLVPESSRAVHPAHRVGYVKDPRPRSMGAGPEVRGRRRDGTSFPAQISLGPVEGDDGGVLVIAAVRDVTEQRRAEARFHTLLEGAPDAVVGLEADGTIVLLNAQAEQRFATSRSRAVGARFPVLLAGTTTTTDGDVVDLVPAADRDRLEGAVDDVLRGRREELTLRYRVSRVDGSHAVLEALGRVMSDVTGERGMLLISRDVSEHVHLEVALRAAKDEADEASQAKNRFLSRVSHELRTPLNAILGFGQLLEMQDLAADDAEAVRQVLRGGRHLLSLVNEVLDIARIESEELVSPTEPVALEPLVGELVELVAPLASGRRVDLVEGSAGACVAWVEADRDRLRQVLLNLVANGIKYNHPGGSVGLSASTTDGVVRISVTDDGWGIPEAEQHRLFQPFDRLGATLTDVEGTGVGLALSRGLVHAMGGQIGVESVEGRGSTFWVDLPAAPDGDGHRGTASEARAATILLIEDDPANMLLTRRILKRFTNVDVVTADSGAEGLDCARAATPDLVLLDLQLPDMTGEEILAELHRDPATRDVAPVVLSADADPERLAALRSAGAQGTLSKPIDVPAFVDLVTGMLARRPG